MTIPAGVYSVDRESPLKPCIAVLHLKVIYYSAHGYTVHTDICRLLNSQDIVYVLNFTDCFRYLYVLKDEFQSYSVHQ